MRTLATVLGIVFLLTGLIIKYTNWIRTDNILMAFVWKLPRWVIYWSAIRLWAHGTSGKWGNTSPTELTFDVALDRWNCS